MRWSAPSAPPATRESFRRQLRGNELNDKEIEIQVADAGPQFPTFDIPGGQVGMINLNDMLGKAFGQRTKPRKRHGRPGLRHADRAGERQAARPGPAGAGGGAQRSRTTASSSSTRSTRSARARRRGRIGADVSREGVQRDLLPLIEGTTVSTKYGPVKTDHVLFIASGAFHVAKPSDLLPELQGRLPIRVELKPLTTEDLRRILAEPEASLIKQYVALMATEGVTLEFTDDAIDALADIAAQVNSTVENIGARRLQTVMERVLDEISFDATDKGGETIHDRCRLRARAHRRPRQERRPEQVHPVGSVKILVYGSARVSPLSATATALRAEVREVSLGQQFGAVYLPAMVMESQKLVEKHLAAAGIGDVKVGWAKLGGPAAINDAMLSGNVHFACQGVPSMAVIWDRTEAASASRPWARSPTTTSGSTRATPASSR